MDKLNQNNLNKFREAECSYCEASVKLPVIEDYNRGRDSKFLTCPFCQNYGWVKSDLEQVRESSLTCLKGGSSHRGVSEDENEKDKIRRELKFQMVEEGYITAAGSMDACGNASVEIECNNCGDRHHVDHHCDNRVCDKCGESRWSRTVKSLKKRIFNRMDWNNVRFMTLTYGNLSELTRSDIKDIREDFKRLKRREFFAGRIDGGVYSIECNWTDNGWNLHLHVVYQGGFIQQDRLSEAWEDLTGYPVVDIRKSNDKDSDAEELAKYITKQPDVSSDDSDESPEVKAERLMEYHRAMYQTNLIQPFGIFHHSSDHAVSLKWANAKYECPECGSTDITVVPPPSKEIGYSLTPSDPDEVFNLESYGVA